MTPLIQAYKNSDRCDYFSKLRREHFLITVKSIMKFQKSRKRDFSDIKSKIIDLPKKNSHKSKNKYYYFA